ncbi:hypothetical protein GRI62_11730 [Erythrobacter arachoides]|uniref:Uncharacterized protein n=1 Tax=Aurantiacibacter arachoides TaxID=1850444 RepID=A0A845A298_9SPHN|nr:hypothetical protein [Aurantiacibacter arachoides]MXO94265.1 hypothetical protein [Aurantiacibacter arachoides]GGD64844.1 hypothetical protein GCM10011411_26430 [Aurantiacibacter arachoides]
MPIKVSSAKSKGRRLQQAARDAILAAFPDLEEGDVRSCAMGSQGEDLQLSPAAARAFPFSVECKAKAKGFTVLYDALGQAAGQNDRTPLAVVKQDRRKPLVVIDLDDFLKLVRR